MKLKQQVRIIDLLVREFTLSASEPRCRSLVRQNLANGGKSMKDMILFFSLLLIVSCTACNPGPQPAPQATPAPQGTTAKLTLTMIGNTGTAPHGFGKGTVTFAPTPQSGNANCNLIGNNPITCTANFAPGATVVLTVLPNDSTLESINGCNRTACEGCPPGATTCQLTMNGDKSVNAVLVGLIH